MKNIFTILIPLVFLVGCNNVAAINGLTSQQKAMIDSIIVTESYNGTHSKDKVDPLIVPSTRHQRADCPVGGWITQGDGHKSRCPDCDPPYSGDIDNLQSAIDDLSAKVSAIEEKKPAKLAFDPALDWRLPVAERKLIFEQNKVSWKTANGKCSPDCKCATCYCMYPGQCLVEANGGKPVTMYKTVVQQSCSGRSCSNIQSKVPRVTYKEPN